MPSSRSKARFDAHRNVLEHRIEVRCLLRPLHELALERQNLEQFDGVAPRRLRSALRHQFAHRAAERIRMHAKLLAHINARLHSSGACQCAEE